MTLLITFIAAIVATFLWYKNAPKDVWFFRVPCYMYWGASIMWFADACFEYRELRAAYFTPSLHDMVNDAFLGVSAVALGACVWLVILLMKDPRGVIFKKSKNKISDISN